MSTRSWTPQQRQAIEDRGGALLLAAAAGSGKTAVLTQRAVELLADEGAGIAADRLLIVTFTNAAAAELRQRMAAAFEEKLAARPNSAFLRRQKLLLGRANICTVDSFCIDLVTQHFNETDLPGDFTVIKAAEEAALRQQALEETLEEAYQDPDFCSFASLFGRARSDKAATDALLRLYDIACTMADPAGWWAALERDYTVHTTPADTGWGRQLLDGAAMVLRGVLQRLDRARQLADAEALDALTALLQTDYDQAAALLAAVEAADWSLAYRLSKGLTFGRFPRLARGVDPLVKGRIQALRNECKALLQELPQRYFASDLQEFLAEQAICLPMVRALVRAVTRFAELLFQKKQEAHAFAFDDLEHAALGLLQGADGAPTPLARDLQRRYALVMVDEYQDTNDLQDRLYRMLAAPDQSNLFFVGDVKQSIYGFRQAKPDCFIQKRDAYAPYDGVHYPATILLSRNFRSTPGVLAGINDIFAPLFCRAVGGVDYADGEALVPGLPDDPLPLPVQVLITDISPQEDDAPPQAATAEGAAGAAASQTAATGARPLQTDAGTVARLIADMLELGAPVRSPLGTARSCRPGDFCILLRSPGASARRYVRQLEALGIGAYCRAEDPLLADPQVGLLLSFLRVLDNPGQDIHLAAVMLSPLFGFTPDDLVALRCRCRKGTLYAALLQQPPGPFADFLAALRSLRDRCVGLPVQDICALLLEDTGLYHLAGAAPGAQSCQQNLRAFQAVAAEYAGSGGLSGFLRLVDAAIQNDRPLSGQRAAGGPTDKVQLMSIHASKGLEFPIVILADASHGFNEQDAIGNFLCHSDLGVAFRLQTTGKGKTLTPTLATRALAERMRRETADEEMRLLYVALTRARDRLILSWADKRPPAALEKRAAALDACGGRPDQLALRRTGTDGMSHWLQLALLAHPDADVLRRACGREDLCLRTDTGGHFQFRLCAAAPDAAPNAAAPSPAAVPDPQLTATLLQNFARRPAAAQPLPVKVSVSSLSHHQGTATLDKPAFLYEQGMNAAQRGTALHRFLQLADLAAARQDLPAELARLVRQGYLEAAVADGIDQVALRRFLQSPLLQRMLNAPTLLREYEFISRAPVQLLPAIADAAPGDPCPAPNPDAILPPDGAAEGAPAGRISVSDDMASNSFIEDKKSVKRADMAMDPTAAATGPDQVFLLGIADCVLLSPDGAELIDYKTDRNKTPAQLVDTYATQLALYRQAVEKRLGVRVKRSVIYSFALGQEIVVQGDPI